MNKCISILMLLLVLSIAIVLLAQTGSAPTSAGAASDDRYQLTSLIWRVSGCVEGGGYGLQALARPALQGNGCCCMYLPIIIK